MKYLKPFNEATDLSHWKFEGIQKIIRDDLNKYLDKTFAIKITAKIKTNAQIAGTFDVIIRKINDSPNTSNKHYKYFKYGEVEEAINSIKELLKDKYTISQLLRTSGGGAIGTSLKEFNKEGNINDYSRDAFLKSNMEKLTITFSRIGKIEQQEVNTDLDVGEIFVDVAEAGIYVKSVVSLGTYDISLTFHHNKKYTQSLYDYITMAIEKCMLYDLELSRIRMTYINPLPAENEDGSYNIHRGPGVLVKKFSTIDEWDRFDKTNLSVQNIKIIYAL